MSVTPNGIRGILFAFIPALAACYTYAPIEPAAVRAGTEVRIRLSSAAADRLAALLGTAESRLISGTLVDTARDTIVVEVPAVSRAELGSSIGTLHQRVSLSRSEIVEMESRHLDRFRTSVLAGSGAILVTAALVKAIKGDPGTERPPGGGGGGEFRAP